MALFTSVMATAPVTLIYDESSNPAPSGEIYYACNWNPETGQPDSGWGGYVRRPMYDDGQHGDGESGDGIWGVITEIAPDPTHKFEWAVDQDADSTNGWLGTGSSFRVASGEPLVVSFEEAPPEARLSRELLEAEYGLTLSSGQAPQVVDGGAMFAFTVEAPDAEMVYLAGSFNGWGENREGIVTNPRFRMYPLDNGVWLRMLELPHGLIRYKFVMRTAEGEYEWLPDPRVEERDPDGNSILELRSLMPEKYRASIPGRPLQKPKVVEREFVEGVRFTDVNVERVWVKPDETHFVEIELAERGRNEGEVLLVRRTRNLLDWEERRVGIQDDRIRLEEEAGGVELPIVLELALASDKGFTDHAVHVLPVVSDPSDDLRYGFYANWDRIGDDYGKKSDMLADLLINAVEYYDYFPAHGIYAPTDVVYEFQPFYGSEILAKDISEKIESGRKRGILSIAYVAAYAASRSVFERLPYPMTNAQGENLIFNGRILTEKAADASGDRKWFWLMAIARDSPWRDYILEEWRRTLLDNPGDLVAFDGLEIDSYGHDVSARYYSEGSAANGRLLSDVIAELIEDTWRMAHSVKDPVAISFNCVNEFGIERMYDITDFIFIENWAGYKSGIEETVEICYRHREPRGQRVVLKMYPADAGFRDPAHFPPDHLRLMMGMCLVGGGSLMIAGEPNEVTGEMHALNSLYYPDNVAIPGENTEIIRRYNVFDAILYGLNHGRMVENYRTSLFVPGCVARGFRNDRGDITVMLLNNGEQVRWDEARTAPDPLVHREVAIDVPANMEVRQVLYLSPDAEDPGLPLKVDFERKGNTVRTLIPELHTTGALVIKAGKESGGN